MTRNNCSFTNPLRRTGAAGPGSYDKKRRDEMRWNKVECDVYYTRRPDALLFHVMCHHHGTDREYGRTSWPLNTAEHQPAAHGSSVGWWGTYCSRLGPVSECTVRTRIPSLMAQWSLHVIRVLWCNSVAESGWMDGWMNCDCGWICQSIDAWTWLPGNQWHHQ